jgi:hypothetical protein
LAHAAGKYDCQGKENRQQQNGNQQFGQTVTAKGIAPKRSVYHDIRSLVRLFAVFLYCNYEIFEIYLLLSYH